jgi:hypothetical protein
MKVKLSPVFPVEKIKGAIPLAKTARAIATKIKARKVKQQMLSIQKNIQKAANDGTFHVHLDVIIMDDNKNALESAGFRVTNKTGHTCIGW